MSRTRAGGAADKASAGPTEARGIVSFVVIWCGSALSQLASAGTNFAMTVWLWERSHAALPIIVLELCSYLAVVALSPVGGVLADRWGQRRTLVLSSLLGALVIGCLWLLYGLGALSETYVYLSMLALGASITLQYPAMAATITTLVPPAQYARANGLLSLSVSVSGVVAPALGALLMSSANLGVVFLADIASYAIALATLVVCAPRSSPSPHPTTAGPTKSGARLRADLTLGFRFIAGQPGLLALQVCFFVFYFAGMFGVLLAPMVLARTDGNNAVLAGVLSAAGVGGVLGGLATTAFGILRARPLYVIFAGFMVTGLLGQLPYGISTHTSVWWATSFVGAFVFPFILAAHQTIWQTRVPVEIQGRVFAARRVLTESAGPIALLLSGPLADHVFEPAMRGPLGSSAGWLVGTGAGSGMALLLVLSGLLSVVTGCVGYRVVRLPTGERDAAR
ncbi:MFS transporter [Streptomyces sp. QH1-20]|uniref:MFS transporter n=1 Tax=Streptomyces sp. QH1-20 TaxID=3240934 RepID=UPI003518E5BF